MIGFTHSIHSLRASMDEQQKPLEVVPMHASKGDAETNKWWGVLGYISILCLVPLLARKESPFAQHHAKQGTVLFIAGVLLSIISFVLPWVFIGLLVFVGDVLLFILGIMGIVYAWQGKMWNMPVLGEFAKKIKV